MAPGWIASTLALCLIAVGCTSPPATLSDAITADDLARVERHIDEGADLEGPLVFGLTPLMRAANRDNTEIVAALVEAGADVDGAGSGGLTPLHTAARSDAMDALSYLLDAGGRPEIRSASGMNALDHAAASGSTDVLVALTSHGAIEVDTPSQAVTQGHGHPRDLGPTPLGLAVRGGHIEGAAALIDLGAVVDGPSASGHTPLLLAVFSDQPPEMVRLLLDAGADPYAEAACDLGCSAGGGRFLTAVEWASELGRDELVALLPPLAPGHR